MSFWRMPIREADNVVRAIPAELEDVANLQATHTPAQDLSDSRSFCEPATASLANVPNGTGATEEVGPGDLNARRGTDVGQRSSKCPASLKRHRGHCTVRRSKAQIMKEEPGQTRSAQRKQTWGHRSIVGRELDGVPACGLIPWPPCTSSYMQGYPQ